VIWFEFECDADGCQHLHRVSLRSLSSHQPNKFATFFDTALHVNREHGWRVEGNGKDLPDWDCKVFCPTHLHLHRDNQKGT